MQITIKPGEYLFNTAGFHVCDAQGFAKRATEETTVDVSDAGRIAFIEAYQADARYVPPAPEPEPAHVDAPVEDGVTH
jgi:uncharacterized protein YuzE